MFANDKIRVIFMLPMEQDPILGEFTNTAPQNAEKGGGILSMEKEELTKVNFRRLITFKQSISMEFSPELNGMKTYQYGFHNTRVRDTSLYNNWNFTSPRFWDNPTPDSFWYSDTNTQLYLT